MTYNVDINLVFTHCFLHELDRTSYAARIPPGSVESAMLVAKARTDLVRIGLHEYATAPVRKVLEPLATERGMTVSPFTAEDPLSWSDRIATALFVTYKGYRVSFSAVASDFGWYTHGIPPGGCTHRYGNQFRHVQLKLDPPVRVLGDLREVVDDCVRVLDAAVARRASGAE